MGKGAILSGLLHLVVLLLAVFGLPWLYDTNEVLQATPVSVISEAQFAELQSKTPPAQQKKLDQPKDKEIPPAPKAPDVAQPAPEPEPPPEPEPQQAAEPPPQPPPPEPPQQTQQQQPAVQPQPPPEPPQQVVAPEPPLQPKPEPVPPPEPQVAEAQPKPVPPKKPTPPKKKEEPKKKEIPKDEQAADDTSWLLDVDKKLKEKQKKASQAEKSQPKESQVAETDPGIPQRLPFGEEDSIRQQVEPHWNYNPGLPGLDKMTVDLVITMNPDGTVQKVEFANPQAVNSDPNYRAFAESAMRAVYVTAHIKMPPNRPYELWRRIIMGFRVANL